jgi:hypothetical protein
MTSSRLNASTNNLSRWGDSLTGKLLLAVLAMIVVALPGVAEARRRIVILDFEGPKAEQFRVDVERLVKKSHMVIPVEKWNSAAEEMDATSLSSKDVKKVAKRLNVDGVISGKIEKRRDEYIVRLKVREGSSGEVVGSPIDSKTGGARLDGAATREIKTELFDTLDTLDTGGGGGDGDEAEEEEERPRKFVKRGGSSEAEEGEEAEEEVKPTKGKKGKPVEEEEEVAEVKPTKGKKGKPVEEEEEVAEVKPTKGKKGKPVEEEEEVAEVKPTKGKKGKPVEEEEEVVEVKPTKPAKPVKEPVVVAEVKPTKPAKPVKEPVVVAEVKPTKPVPVKPVPEPAVLAVKQEPDSANDKPFVPKTKPKKTKPKKAKAKVVASDDDLGSDEGLSDSFEPLASDEQLNVAHRAIDVAGGMSFTMRRLRFTTKGLTASDKPPRSYDSVPVAGINIDAEGYPLAFGHKNKGVLTNIGLAASFDRTFSIRTRLRYTDAGQMREKELQSTYLRFMLGAIYRHNLGSPSSPLVVTGAFRFGSQSFTIDRGGLSAATVDVPAVKYTIFEPSVGIKYGLGKKITLGAELGALLMTGTGDIQEMDQYGAATVTAFEGEAFFDYLITSKVFARASFRAETIGFKFKGYGMLSTMRDADPDQDVTAARDTYFGGSLTAGYLF